MIVFKMALHFTSQAIGQQLSLSIIVVLLYFCKQHALCFAINLCQYPWSFLVRGVICTLIDMIRVVNNQTWVRVRKHAFKNVARVLLDATGCKDTEMGMHSTFLVAQPVQLACGCGCVHCYAYFFRILYNAHLTPLFCCMIFLQPTVQADLVLQIRPPFSAHRMHATSPILQA